MRTFTPKNVLERTPKILPLKGMWRETRKGQNVAHLGARETG